MFCGRWAFKWLANDISQVLEPVAGEKEVAFWGRSNVGKSTLINALTGQKKLAKSSSAPGRTRAIIYFECPNIPLKIIDLPGYGYAKAPQSEIRRWQGLVERYLANAPGLMRVYLLIDARRGIGSNDHEALTKLDDFGVSYQIVLSKCDKLAPSALATILQQTTDLIAKRPAAHPRIIATASKNRSGFDDLHHELASLITPPLFEAISS